MGRSHLAEVPRSQVVADVVEARVIENVEGIPTQLIVDMLSKLESLKK